MEEPEKKQRQQKIERLKTDLFSGNDKKVAEALHEIPEEGDASLIPALVAVASTNNREDIRLQVEKILFSLKDNQVVPYLVTELQNAKTDEIQALVAGAIWQSGLDASEEIVAVCETATKARYLTCLECLTVIENNTDHATERDIQECIGIVAEAIETADETITLLNSIRNVLTEKLIGQ